MHIVWVLKSYWDTISDRATWVEMSHALEARGHRVTVITGYRARRDPHGLTDVIFVPSLKAPYLNQITQAISAAGALGRLLRRRQPDVVIVDAQAWLSALPYAALARLSRRLPRFVLDVRTVPVDLRGLKGRVIDAVFWAGLRTANRYYNGASAITPYMAQTLRTRYGITLPLGIWSSAVSLAAFDPAAVAPQKVASLRAQFRVADGDMLLLYHGSYGVYRGLVNLIQAMVEVRATLPGAVLVLLGSGRVADDLQRLIVRLGLRGAVVLHPPVPHDQTPAYIAAADLGVLPFPRLRWWRVSSPLKLMEYMAMGTPVVVTEIEAHRDVLGRSPAAFFAPDGRPSSLAAAIIRAAGRGADLPQLGLELRELAASRYQWRQQAAALEELLLRITLAVSWSSALAD